MTQYEYHNYIDLGIGGSRKSINTHLIIETTSGVLYIVDSVDASKIYKSTDKGDNWVEIEDRTKNIWSAFYRSSTGYIYFIESPGDYTGWKSFSLKISNDSITEDLDRSAQTENGIDYYYVGDTKARIWMDDNGTYYSITVNFGTSSSWQLIPDHEDNALNITYITVAGSKHWFIYEIADKSLYLCSYESGGAPFTREYTLGYTTYELPSNRNQLGISYDGTDILYFVLKKISNAKYYLMSYSISNDTLTEGGEFNVALMLDRNVHGTNPPNNLEKGFHLTQDRVYQIPSTYTGRLNWISAFNFADTIIAITDHFVIDNSGNVYEYMNLISSILIGWIYHSRQDYPYLEMKFNSDNITILTQMFIQIIGSYTVDGSTTANQVVFEGIAKRPTKGRFQYVHVDNQASEMDQVEPRGIKAGRSDQIISDINDDGAPTGPEYIVDGTLAEGSAMGTLALSGAKKYRTVMDDLAEHDGFLWSIRTQGALDYNAGGVDSGADLKYDGSGNLDKILQLQAWTIAKLNQITVNGAINPITGIPYSGKWDDEDDQQINGINPITIEDAQLNSDALCQAKADEMGANEVERTRARFKFRKITYGFIQPGQTITFKYDVTNYITISEAQYILDKLTMNIKTEIGFAELSSGL